MCRFLWRVNPRPTGIEREAEAMCVYASLETLFYAKGEEPLWGIDKTIRTLHSELSFSYPKIIIFMAVEKQSLQMTQGPRWYIERCFSPSQATPMEKPTSSVGMNVTPSCFPWTLCPSVRAILLQCGLY